MDTQSVLFRKCLRKSCQSTFEYRDEAATCPKCDGKRNGLVEVAQCGNCRVHHGLMSSLAEGANAMWVAEMCCSAWFASPHRARSFPYAAQSDGCLIVDGMYALCGRWGANYQGGYSPASGVACQRCREIIEWSGLAGLLEPSAFTNRGLTVFPDWLRGAYHMHLRYPRETRMYRADGTEIVDRGQWAQDRHQVVPLPDGQWVPSSEWAERCGEWLGRPFPTDGR